MALNPEVMAKAQKEIDAVVGNERLPGFADRENLPYINALVKEVFRWHSVVPTGNLKSDTSIRSYRADLRQSQAFRIVLCKMIYTTAT